MQSKNYSFIKMGNSYCCSSGVNKEELLRKSDILLECGLKLDKINDHNRRENKSNKTISTFSSKNEDGSVFVNPLPEFVIIKMKKNHKKNLINI